ncbi:MAG: hypothetical protein NVS4B3_24180 [Gemmatimonadaceae bacterium]
MTRLADAQPNYHGNRTLMRATDKSVARSLSGAANEGTRAREDCVTDVERRKPHSSGRVNLYGRIRTAALDKLHVISLARPTQLPLKRPKYAVSCHRTYGLIAPAPQERERDLVLSFLMRVPIENHAQRLTVGMTNLRGAFVGGGRVYPFN